MRYKPPVRWMSTEILNPIRIRIRIGRNGIGLDAENSYALWEDNENGTGTMSLSILDFNGDGITGLGMDDIAVQDATATNGDWIRLADAFGTSGWDNITLEDQGSGNYEILWDSSGVYGDYDELWNVRVCGLVITENLDMVITGS